MMTWARMMGWVSLAVSDFRSVTDAELRSACEAAERNYRMACSGGDEQTTVEAALDYIHAAYLVPGTGMELLAPFTHVVRVMDSQPSWWSREFTDPVLWAYKWVVRSALSTPDVALTDIGRLIDGMERRYQEHGQSLRPVVKMRMVFAEECYGSGAAAEFFGRWQAMDTTRYCDCPECEPTLLLGWYARTGQQDVAASLALDVMSGHIEAQCMDQPQEFYACAIEPLLVQGHVREASWVQRMSFRLDQHRPSRFNLLTHAQVLARTGNFDDALAFLGQAGQKPASSPRGEAFGLAMAACALKFGPEGAPEREYWPGFVGSPRSVSGELFEAALHLGERFDARNGSTTFTDELRWVLARESLAALDEVSSPVTGQSGFAQLDADLVEADAAGTPSARSSAASDTRRSSKVAADRSFALSSVSNRAAAPEVFDALAVSDVGASCTDPGALLTQLRESVTGGSAWLASYRMAKQWLEHAQEDFAEDLPAGLAPSSAEGESTDVFDYVDGREPVSESRAISYSREGAYLDCFAFFFDRDPDIAGRAEETAVELDIPAVLAASEIIRFCGLKTPTPELLSRIADRVSDVDLLADKELSPMVLALLYRRLHQWGLEEVPEELVLSVGEELGATARGRCSRLLITLETDLSQASDLYTQLEVEARSTGHSADILYQFCTTAAIGAWASQDSLATLDWLKRAHGLLRQATVVEFVQHNVELQVRASEMWPSAADALADYVVSACRHGALLSPKFVLPLVGRAAGTLHAAGRNLDLVELGEAAVATVDYQTEDDTFMEKRVRDEFLLQVHEQIVAAAHSLHEYRTALHHAERACASDSKDPFVWLIYSLEASDNDNSIELARRLTRACELCWEARDAVSAVEHLPGLVVAVHAADGSGPAEAVAQEWQDRIESIAEHLDSQLKSLADVRVSTAWATLKDAQKAHSEAIGWRNKAVQAAEVSGQPGEMVASLSLLASSYCAAERFADAESVLEKLGERFPDSPTTPELRMAVSQLAHYLSSSGRGAQADVLMDRYGL